MDKWYIFKNQNWISPTCGSFPLIVSHMEKVLGQFSIKIHCSNRHVYEFNAASKSIILLSNFCKWYWLIPCVSRENRHEMGGESTFFQLVRCQFSTNQNEFNIYNRRRVSAKNAKNPSFIGYSVHEIQCLKYRSAGARHEMLLCTDTEIKGVAIWWPDFFWQHFFWPEWPHFFLTWLWKELSALCFCSSHGRAVIFTFVLHTIIIHRSFFFFFFVLCFFFWSIPDSRPAQKYKTNPFSCYNIPLRSGKEATQHPWPGLTLMQW